MEILEATDHMDERLIHEVALEQYRDRETKRIAQEDGFRYDGINELHFEYRREIKQHLVIAVRISMKVDDCVVYLQEFNEFAIYGNSPPWSSWRWTATR